MIKYPEKVKSLVNGFTNFSINQVPQSKNKKADALSKIASTSFAHLSKQVLVEILKEKSIQEKEVTTVVEEDGPTWMTPIIEYLKEGTLPNDRKEARKLRIQYELLEEVLYRRSFLTSWLSKAPVVQWTPRKSKPELEGRNQGPPGSSHTSRDWNANIRTAAIDAVHNDEELRLNLDLLEERRERAAIREAKAKLKM
nr:reverse transcriptase domain-containing protein [Tanacetum cinerariifolium]